MTNTKVIQLGEEQTWTSTLRRLLLTPTGTGRTPHSGLRNNPPRRPNGIIWREVVLLSVYNDLMKNSGIGLRRLVKFSVVGLEGLILYQISMERLKRHFGHLRWDSDDIAFKKSRDLKQEARENQWICVLKGALEEFFYGDTDQVRDPRRFEEVLDAVKAVVIYLPALACTSFVAGQMMSSYLASEPSIKPIPAFEGISIDPKVYQDVSGNDSTIAISPFLEQWRRSKCQSTTSAELSSSSSESITIEIQGEDETPSLPSDEQLSSGESEDETGGSMATTDSMGPRTPPSDSVEPPIRLDPYLSAEGYLSPLGSSSPRPTFSESLGLLRVEEEEKVVQEVQLTFDEVSSPTDQA